MPAIRPDLKLPKKFADKLPNAEALPVLTDEIKQQQKAAFKGKCKDGNCRLTQFEMELGTVRQLVTSCGKCGERAAIDCAL